VLRYLSSLRQVLLDQDAGGFAPVEAVAHALAAQRGWESLTTADLLALAEADPRRYEVRDGRIRARYGHTVHVEQPAFLLLPIEPSDNEREASREIA